MQQRHTLHALHALPSPANTATTGLMQRLCLISRLCVVRPWPLASHTATASPTCSHGRHSFASQPSSLNSTDRACLYHHSLHQPQLVLLDTAATAATSYTASHSYHDQHEAAAAATCMQPLPRPHIYNNRLKTTTVTITTIIKRQKVNKGGPGCCNTRFRTGDCYSNNHPSILYHSAHKNLGAL